ncbi:hypothetical protein B0H14DRAFT_3137715 [Mycena olivaceomarginata]|nr:hypothetical protein B0H14DRAFT_3137715 [Mycena olivaceomarginata]
MTGSNNESIRLKTAAGQYHKKIRSSPPVRHLKTQTWDSVSLDILFRILPFFWILGLRLAWILDGIGLECTAEALRIPSRLTTPAFAHYSGARPGLCPAPTQGSPLTLPHRVAPLIPSRVYFAKGSRIVLRAFRPGPPPPPPEPAPPRVVRTSAALAMLFHPASTCAAPRTLFGTPVSLCAHRTVSFAAGGAAAAPVPFRLHPHMLRILVPVSTRPSQSTSTPAPLARVLPALPPCTPTPDSPPPRTCLYTGTLSLVIRTAAVPPSCALPRPFFPASSCARPCAPACPSRYTFILGILSTILVVVVILVDGVTKTESPGSLWSPADTSSGIDNRNHLGIAFGLFMAGLSSHAAILSLARDMTDPSEFNTMIDWVLVVATSIYALIGSAWYNAALNQAALWMLVISPRGSARLHPPSCAESTCAFYNCSIHEALGNPPTMSATNTVVQRTSFGRIADEEQGFPDTRSNTRTSEPRPKMEPDSEAGGTVYKMAARFMRKGKRKIGVLESLKATTFSSYPHCIGDTTRRRATRRRLEISRVHLFCVSWPSYGWKSFSITCGIGGEQMAFYLGEDLGDLLVVTLNKSVKLTVEASLAIILVKKCELKLLQSTVVGGARVLEQDLHPHLTQLNHTLLTIGIMTLLLPAACFAALNHGSSAAPEAESFINDMNHHVFLQMSRGLAVILLPVLVAITDTSAPEFFFTIHQVKILSSRNTSSPLKFGRNTRYCDRNTPRCQEAVELIWENIDNSPTIHKLDSWMAKVGLLIE